MSSIAANSGAIVDSTLNSASGFNLLKKLLVVEPLLFPFENTFDPVPVIMFSKNTFWLGPVCCLLYLAFVYVGPKYMKNRPSFDLRTPLRFWNLFCAIMSFWGMLRVVPHLWMYAMKVGFGTTLCAPPVVGFRHGAASFWGTVFVYSKFLELIDTVFIVLRKRHLSFLHWYHHATVLLCTWFTFIVEQPAGLYFCAMNYTVHSIMYFYYYLAMSSEKPPRWGMFVTILQILQMFAGTIITVVALVYALRYPILPHSFSASVFKPSADHGCHLSLPNLYACSFMYATYLYLFAAFFCSRYLAYGNRKVFKKTVDVSRKVV